MIRDLAHTIRVGVAAVQALSDLARDDLMELRDSVAQTDERCAALQRRLDVLECNQRALIGSLATNDDHSRRVS